MSFQRPFVPLWTIRGQELAFDVRIESYCSVFDDATQRTHARQIIFKGKGEKL